MFMYQGIVFCSFICLVIHLFFTCIGRCDILQIPCTCYIWACFLFTSILGKKVASAELSTSLNDMRMVFSILLKKMIPAVTHAK